MKPIDLNIISNKGNVYTISNLNNPLGDPYCDCNSFRYNGTCKHIKMAEDQLKEMLNEQRD
jgi:hypothetical protein